MKTLKEKFGKFELSNTQAKNVAGGSENSQVICKEATPTGVRILGVHSVNTTPATFIALYGNLSNFIGCF